MGKPDRPIAISRMLVGFRLGWLAHHAQHLRATGFQETP
jgi:hypothetical protein